MSVNELTQLVVTNAATEPNIHSVTLGYGLVGPTGATIDTNGVITWTPNQFQSPGTYLLTTSVTNRNPYDTVNPQLLATNSLSVVVFAPSNAPVLSINAMGTGLLITWNSETGAVYRLQYMDSITNMHWNDVSNDLVATGTQTILPITPITNAQRFYRILRVR